MLPLLLIMVRLWPGCIMLIHRSSPMGLVGAKMLCEIWCLLLRLFILHSLIFIIQLFLYSAFDVFGFCYWEWGAIC